MVGAGETAQRVISQPNSPHFVSEARTAEGENCHVSSFDLYMCVISHADTYAHREKIAREYYKIDTLN